MKIAIGSDHGGIHLKNHIKAYLEGKGYEVIDHGTYTEDSCDYPDFAKKVCDDITSGTSGAEKGILVCGTGIGISMAANKCKGIRAAVVADVFSAKMAAEHNNANVICMGERTTGIGIAEMMVDIFLATPFAGGRHQRRIDKIMALEK
ncbi:MAG: ribose 5-phosphate isomerase B [Phascolarctobacterium sp.]|nr:ribose 5-phosphate isomerase B [Phascolarctobacterium sp.]